MLVEVTNLQERGGEVVVLLSISLTTTIMGQKTEIRGGRRVSEQQGVMGQRRWVAWEEGWSKHSDDFP